MSTATRGFASMPRKRLREIATAASQRAQALGTAHRWTEDEAKQASAKGKVKRLAALKAYWKRWHEKRKYRG
jgi:hypothetical protein